MNEINLNKPQVAYTETKLKVLITDIQKRLDKNQKDYWIIKTRTGDFVDNSYLAFSNDYNITQKALSLLMNYQESLRGRMVNLTIRKNGDKEKVIAMEIAEE